MAEKDNSWWSRIGDTGEQLKRTIGGGAFVLVQGGPPWRMGRRIEWNWLGATRYVTAMAIKEGLPTGHDAQEDKIQEWLYDWFVNDDGEKHPSPTMVLEHARAILAEIELAR